MNNGTKSLSINETFIIEPVDGVEVYSACTAFYTNNLISCSGNTEIIMGIGGVSTNLAFSAVTFYGDGSNLTGISTQDTYITGGTYSAGTTRLFDSSGNTITIGGYFTPSDDIYVSGLTFNTSNYDLTVKRNDGVNFTQNLSILASDLTITGGTYNPSTGTATFTNNTGGTFNVTGFLTGFTDIFVTGATFNNDNLRLTRNDNNNINVAINKFNSLTANTISATTYENLPIKYYAEFSGSPSIRPIVYSANSIAIGDGAEALNEHMFVVGQYAGGGATDSFSSVFLGQEAGNQATNSYQSNFIGYYAGNQSYDSYSSNFIGTQAGLSTSSQYSNFIGDYTGVGGFGNNSNLIGNQAGYGAQHNTVNFIGYYAGWGVVDSVDTNFIGNYAGSSANYGSSSNFVGTNSGYGADYVTDTNFIGPYAGYLSNNISNSNFLGSYAGYQGVYNSNSNFIGPDAGNSANYAEGSNFIGYSSGYQANNTTNSNFLGSSAGSQATYTTGSTFIGAYAGYGSSNINYSNFIGFRAGSGATNASYSTLIGYNVGFSPRDVSLSVGENNIIIGTNITLPPNTVDKINIGGVLFGSNTYANPFGSPFTGTSYDGRIGINVVNPTHTLHVNGNTKIDGYTIIGGDATIQGVVSGIYGNFSGSSQNILTVTGSGNSTTEPIFKVLGSQGELFSVKDTLTGSLFSVNDISGLPILEAFSDNTVLMGSYSAPSLNTTSLVMVNSGTTNIYSIPVSAYTGGFFDYTVSDGANARAGNIMTIFSGSTVLYTESSTLDIGVTSGITFSVVISGGNAVLRTSAITNNWRVKTIIRSI